MRRNKARDNGTARLKPRLYAVAALFAFVFGALLYRAFSLQVLEGGALKRMADSQHLKTVVVQPKRGHVYDRLGKELAISLEVDSVYAHPVRIDGARPAARALAPVLTMDARDLEKRLKSDKGFVWLKRRTDLGDDGRRVIDGLDGVGVTKESRRYYPNGSLAANLIGFTGVDSSGLEGVEQYYDAVLKGRGGKISGERDAMGRLIVYEDFNKDSAAMGKDVQLTIDKTVQYITEKALRKAVDSSRARGGTAVVMDPSTGEVLAMASYPTYDPNDIRGASAEQWRNRAVADAFEPGSIFKLFLVSAALEENVVKPGNRIWCEDGSYRVADRTFHDVKKHGWLTVSEIIKYSSNIGASKIGEKLGRERLARYVKAFGFGAKTGIDLPGESSGSFSSTSRWSDVTLHTVSFGQGVSASAIQLVTALSAVANRGLLMKPYVVKSIRDSDGSLVMEANPAVVRRVVSEATADKITAMLVGVTRTDGTGTRAAVDGLDVAGKTGTAQKPDLRAGGYMRDAFVASFMGFVPAGNPKLAIIVAVDEPRGDYHGGAVAAPAFSEIASQTLAYMGVFPEGGPDGRAFRVAAVDAEPEFRLASAGGAAEYGPGAVPDFTGKTVRAAISTAAERALDLELVGSGRAVAQRPLPGRKTPPDGRVTVWFR